MKRPDFSKQNLVNAAEACGLLPLDTCDLEQLADHLDKTLKAKPARLLRRIIWINSILKWLGRKPLDYPKSKRTKVKYINEDEFLTILGHIKDDTDKQLARIAFYTGMRLGEIFGLSPHHVKDSRVNIENQMTNINEGTKDDPSFKEDTPKNGESRESFYPAKVKAELTAWSNVPFKDRQAIRMRRYSDVMQSACITEFGTLDPIKVLSFRDLRHCHAIWLLQSGATIAEVAQQIGDGVEVCYRHYTGFELKKESIERFKRLVD